MSHKDKQQDRFRLVQGNLETTNTSQDEHIISLKLSFNIAEKGYMTGILDTKQNKMLSVAYSHDVKRVNKLKRDLKTLNEYAGEL